MILYFVKSLLLSALLYLLFKLFLARGYNFKFNRFYLIISILLLSFWPLASFTLSAEVEPLFIEKSSKALDQIERVTTTVNQNIELTETPWNVKMSLISIYILISSLLLIRFIFNLIKLLKTKSIDEVSGMKVYPNQESGTYSFFKRLYLSSKPISPLVIEHEKAHANQFHSFDICLIEIARCLLWYNPFIWLFRKEIKKNHEFLADKRVIERYSEIDYLTVIMKNLHHQNETYIRNHFSYSLIKNRIKMIKNRRNQNSGKNYSIAATLIGAVIILSAFSFKAEQIDKQIDNTAKAGVGLELLKAPKGLPISKSNIIESPAGFGKRKHPIYKTMKLHRGIDLLAAVGTPILATADGEVSITKANEAGYGKHVKIEHNSKYSTLYAHMSSILVQEGDAVEQGDTIGIIGSSGTSVQVHLHYEIHENGEAVDPLNFIKIKPN